MIKEEFSMRDIDAFLNSLVNIDRDSLVAILSSEVAAARQVVNSARQRTASQRAKRQGAEQHAARIERILSFFQRGNIAPGMSRHDIELCKSVERKFLARQRRAAIIEAQWSAKQRPLAG
jgi:hypothetical protein